MGKYNCKNTGVVVFNQSEMKAEKPFQGCSTGASLPPVGVRAPPRPQWLPRPHARTRGALAPRSLPPAVSSQRTARVSADGGPGATGRDLQGVRPALSWGPPLPLCVVGGGKPGRGGAGRLLVPLAASQSVIGSRKREPGETCTVRLRETRAGGGRSPCRQSKDAPLAPAAEGTGMEAGEGQQGEPATVPSHGGPSLLPTLSGSACLSSTRFPVQMPDAGEASSTHCQPHSAISHHEPPATSRPVRLPTDTPHPHPRCSQGTYGTGSGCLWAGSPAAGSCRPRARRP